MVPDFDPEWAEDADAPDWDSREEPVDQESSAESPAAFFAGYWEFARGEMDPERAPHLPIATLAAHFEILS